MIASRDKILAYVRDNHNYIKVPANIKNMDILSLKDAILNIKNSTLRENGLQLVYDEQYKMSIASCSTCQKNHALAKIRLYLARYSNL